MADGQEVILGYDIKRYSTINKVLRINLPIVPKDWEACRASGTTTTYLEEDMGAEAIAALREINAELRKVHRSSCETIGFKHLDTVDGYDYYATPLGTRQLKPFELELFWDPKEYKEEPEDSTFGIALSGRYYPTFLDWRDPSGGLHPVRFDDQLMAELWVAKAKIMDVLPFWRDAATVVLQRHY